VIGQIKHNTATILVFINTCVAPCHFYKTTLFFCWRKCPPPSKAHLTLTKVFLRYETSKIGSLFFPSFHQTTKVIGMILELVSDGKINLEKAL